MKPRLILLSDLWGQGQSHWWKQYTAALAPHFEVQWYDCCELAQLELTPYVQDHLHQQFVNGGIEQAVMELLQRELEQLGPKQILGFSVGGVIGWKAVQAGLNVDQFYAISATRLRYEQAALSENGRLWYGDKDAFRPKQEWLNRQQLQCHILPDTDHDCYTEPSVIKLITETLVAK